MRAPSSSILVALVPAILALSTVAGAASLSKGTVEVSPSFNFSHDTYSFDGNTSVSITSLGIKGLVGYCVSDMVEIGGAVIVTHVTFDPESGGSGSVTSEGLAAGVHLNFSSTGNIVPFIHGAVGFEANSGDLSAGKETSILAPILDAGIRLMVGGSASVNFGIGYQHTSNLGGARGVSANTIALNVGLSIYPGRAQ